MDVTVEYTFEAAHWLPKVPDTHKCHRLHGHSYKVAVTVADEVRDDGMVMDYADISHHTKPLITQLDHQTLNDIIDNPTCENLCLWLWNQLTPHLPLSAVTVRETDHAYCTYRGATA